MDRHGISQYDAVVDSNFLTASVALKYFILSERPELVAFNLCTFCVTCFTMFHGFFPNVKNSQFLAPNF